MRVGWTVTAKGFVDSRGERNNMVEHSGPEFQCVMYHVSHCGKYLALI